MTAIAGSERQFTAAPSTDLRNFEHLWIPPLPGEQVEDGLPVGAAGWYPPRDKTAFLPRGDIRLDQLTEEKCTTEAVGNAWKARGGTPTERQTLDWYHRAKEIDEWPGVDYGGTSINAAMKAAREKGVVRSWQWIADVNHIVAAVMLGYAVCFPAEWTEGMAYPNQSSIMVPQGGSIGPHATAITGWVGPWGLLQIENSWGAEWGNDGLGYMTWSSFVGLWSAWPEAAVPQFV